jgi:hypothetical protein
MTYQLPLSAVEIAKIEAKKLAEQSPVAAAAEVVAPVVEEAVETEAPVVEETPADTLVDTSIANKLTGFFNNILPK